MIPVYIPTIDDLAWLALAVVVCGILLISFWLTYEWIDEMREESRDERRDY